VDIGGGGGEGGREEDMPDGGREGGKEGGREGERAKDFVQFARVKMMNVNISTTPLPLCLPPSLPPSLTARPACLPGQRVS